MKASDIYRKQLDHEAQMGAHVEILTVRVLIDILEKLEQIEERIPAD